METSKFGEEIENAIKGLEATLHNAEVKSKEIADCIAKAKRAIGRLHQAKAALDDSGLGDGYARALLFIGAARAEDAGSFGRSSDLDFLLKRAAHCANKSLRPLPETSDA